MRPRCFRWQAALCAALTVILPAREGRGQAPAGATNVPARPPPVLATLLIGADRREVELAWREGDTIFYRARGAPPEASTSIKVGGITEGEFELQYDVDAVNRALIARQWPAVAELLVPVVTPLLPYLDIPENNGAELALEAGAAMMRALEAAARQPNADRQRINARYQQAYQILKAVSKATWSPVGEIGALRAVLCLTAVGDLAAAGRELKAARVPDVGDAAYGLYWLAHAHLRYARGESRAAMDAAIKSLVFENKDIDSFPDALMLSARCYEDLLEWHRARDVYYEIAKLFANTDWGATALERLKFIMEKGLTQQKEVVPIEVVFFALDEDVNAKVKALLEGQTEEIETVTDDDIIKEEPVIEEKKKSETDLEAPPATGPQPSPSQAGTKDKGEARQ